MHADGAVRGPAPELVIFDCDGVLVDSELIANTEFARMLEELGLTFSLEQMFERFVGRSMAACMQQVQALLGRAPPPDFEARLRARTERALRRDLRAVRGVRDAIAALRVPYCVASSGDHAKMRLTLGITGLLPLFEGRLFSSTEVAQGKPAPDLFLHAARCMGARPSRTAVVEDSAVGVQAGVAAGMRVLGYAAPGDPWRLALAGASVFSDMSQLPALLGCECAAPAC
jgi:HAD superfamily hydrolase (TIGR01509 family)